MASARDSGKALVVSAAAGQLQGIAREGGGAEFLGIPYAQPPVGELRWHEPVAMKPWSGVRDATKFGAPCSQPDLGDWNRRDAEKGKEDCLFLNVIVPEWPVKKPLPVMFWIHGGANEGGTASSALYKDGTLVNHGVILVTINYRLGIFGFFAHPELTAESAHHASGNYGLMDQVLALQWVRDNIARFGGDVNNITVFGQSAGSMDTSMLMTSPLAKGLFQKAIGESGSAFTAPLLPLAGAERSGQSMAHALGAPAEGQIKYLRAKSAEDLLAVLAKDRNHPRVGPDIDGWVLREQPAAVFQSGQEARIPLLYGTTTREFGSNQSADQLRAAINFAAGEFANLRHTVWQTEGRELQIPSTAHPPISGLQTCCSAAHVSPRVHGMPRHTTRPTSTNSITPSPARKPPSTQPISPTSSATTPNPAT
jgi:para-nitrobenzyl esterase